MDFTGRGVELDVQVVHNHKRFLAYNQRKLDLIRGLLPLRKKRALALVPVLLHVNPRCKTGPLATISPSAPAGVRFLTPPPDLKALLLDLPQAPELPETVWGAKAVEAPILSLLLMGSLGSVGQTTRSDFDFWVVVDRKTLGDKGAEQLSAKLEALTQWLAKGAQAQATFFLVDLEDVRANRFGELAGDSAGSALGTLLKEEFYRSLTLLAGQVPWWWVLPAGLDRPAYEAALAALAESPRLDLNQFVDLGHLARLDQTEYFGASLWEMNKSLDSPFKSALKMALLEAYAQGEDQDLVAEELKAKVMAETEALPDPYLLMFDRAAAHLAAHSREEDLETIRVCLYLKSSPHLSGRDLTQSEDLTGRKALLARYALAWGWTKHQLEALNSYRAWQVSSRLALAERINKYMLQAYARLARELKHMNAKRAKIDPLDLTTVGRRLMLYYGRKEDRVAFLPNLLENPEPLVAVSLALVGRVKGSPASVWEAFEGPADRATPANRLTRTVGLPGLLVFLAVNALADPWTTFYFVTGDRVGRVPVSVPELQKLFGVIHHLFGGLRTATPSRQNLIEPARLSRLLLIPNLEVDESVRELKTISLISHNTWGEVYAEELTSIPDGLAKIREMLIEPDSPLLPELLLHLPARSSAPVLHQAVKRNLAGRLIQMAREVA